MCRLQEWISQNNTSPFGGFWGWKSENFKKSVDAGSRGTPGHRRTRGTTQEYFLISSWRLWGAQPSAPSAAASRNRRKDTKKTCLQAVPPKYTQKQNSKNIPGDTPRHAIHNTSQKYYKDTPRDYLNTFLYLSHIKKKSQRGRPEEPACQPTSQPACLPPACQPSSQPACLPANQPACLRTLSRRYFPNTILCRKPLRNPGSPQTPRDPKEPRNGFRANRKLILKFLNWK